jgi:ADP-heptose:LPS heptosyltransferase
MLIPQRTLDSADKVLFIAHLALGDFAYLHNFFEAFAKQYPSIAIHVWVDELRRTSDSTKWPGLKRYALYDWLRACPFITKIYDETYSPGGLKESIRWAQSERYSLVISLATLRPHRYAKMARLISPDGFLVGMKKNPKFFQFHHFWAYQRLDRVVSEFESKKGSQAHVTDMYGYWFKVIGDVELSHKARFPHLDIPVEWLAKAKKQLNDADVCASESRLIFINPFAKTKKRCWPLEKVVALIKSMRELPAWKESVFLVNAMPQDIETVRSLINEHSLEGTEPFSAEENFFQLPAMLAQCELIISVETAVMHLANAVHVPVIALMRQKNPEWVPIDRENSTVIIAEGKSDWVDTISIQQVLDALP